MQLILIYYLCFLIMLLKALFVSSLLFSLSSLAFAELSISEKVRPLTASKVDPNIQRLELPPTPNNMPLPAFGQGIIGWGTGPEGAATRLDNLTQQDVEKFKTQGVTLEMVDTWQKFYENETRRNAANPTAPLRAELMQKIIHLW